MEASERDSTLEWLVPEAARPPTIRELAERVDEALATARATESAVVTVGAAALDAAEDARRAAELAERASAAVFSARSSEPATAELGDRWERGPDRRGAEDGAPGQGSSVGQGSSAGEGSSSGAERSAGLPEDEDEDLRQFTARADRIAARLRQLESSSVASLG